MPRIVINRKSTCTWACWFAVLGVIITGTCCRVYGVEGMDKKLTPSQIRHAKRVDKANEIVAVRAKKVRRDPLVPVYHYRPAAHWINDPHGIIYYKGKYHAFMQHDIYSSLEQLRYDSYGRGWGHAVSDDLVYWKHELIALVPGPDEYDRDGIWSGCTVIDDDGIPTIFYTSRPQGAQCMAKSYDDMKTWLKYPGNPVITEWPENSSVGYRDPYIWKEDGKWLMIVGTAFYIDGISSGGALLYESDDLVNWKYAHPFSMAEGSGIFWECPNFFPLGDKHAVVASCDEGVKYSVGEYKNRRFTPGKWHLVDNIQTLFWAPNTFPDANGRRIMFGMIHVAGAKDAQWHNVFTVPRVLTLRPDDTMGVEPLGELKKLRGKAYSFKDFTLDARSGHLLKGIKGTSLEIIVEFENMNAHSYGIELLRSDDGKERTLVKYESLYKKLVSENSRGPFKLYHDDERPAYNQPADFSAPLVLRPDEKTLKMHIFLDRTVIEVFVNDRYSFTTVTGMKDLTNQGLKLFVAGGTVKVKSIDVWEMNSCYK